ncbi:TonB-dependent receptor [Sphingomonas sp. 10B4]|uniref:TonB-dependent receptor n=1 Tax=Sphingomonas sp. 10B4 TaxID=3048575 RepID=UPI002AB46E04|nr:TonB-dependent receptor [Sphingomonas sp. 10B4]MDY7524612.1 TonB-dependent receptor [Sphingomonas sp. 10B4]MEB0282431.1 TonB-dependent receptor [Sphingomonas sp. 10B4]
MPEAATIKVVFAALSLLTPLPAIAQDQPDIVVVGSTLPGPVVDRARLPGASQTIGTAALARDGSPDMLRSALRDLAGVSFTEAQDNAYQPDLFYRGYEASPLGGDAQGLAVYVDGARFNQPFGDTINWDLLPDIAIRRVTLESANPAFGLNALGGALAVDLKSGRDLHGVTATASGGAFSKRQITAEAGAHAGPWSFYLAGQSAHDDGWRDFSLSTLHQLYGDVGLDGGWGSLDLKVIGAETALTGNGATPVELLAVRRQAVFTWPDSSDNRYGRGQLSAVIDLGNGFHVRPQAYLTGYRQRTANGDLSDAGECDVDATLLCLDDTPLTGSLGQAFAAFGGDASYAQLNQTQTRTISFGGSLQLDGTRGRHSLAIGASWDASQSRFDAQSILGTLTDNRGFGDPQGVIASADGTIEPVDVKNRRDDLSLYVSDVVAITPQFDLSLSARYNSSRVNLDDQLGDALDGRHLYTRLNPAAGTVWHVGGGTSLYAGYAESSRTPTPAELSCADPDAPCALSAFFVGDPNLKQVVARTWEAGVRGTGAVSGFTLGWQLGGWRATNADDIIFSASDTRGRAYFRNVGRTRRQGVEAWLTLHDPKWDARISYVLTDATFRDGFDIASPDNPEARDDGTLQVNPGDRLPGIPRHLGKVSVTRRFGAVASLSLDGQCSSGRWLAGDEANLTYPTAGYCVANLAGTLNIANGLSLFSEVRNLLDHDYATYGTFSEVSAVAIAEAPSASNTRSLSPAAPRSWSIGARVRF